jgi:hypothetical protein
MTSFCDKNRLNAFFKYSPRNFRDIVTPVVSRRPLTAGAWLRYQVSPCRIRGVQSGIGTGFYQITSVFPCQCHFTTAPCSHISFIYHRRYTPDSVFEYFPRHWIFSTTCRTPCMFACFWVYMLFNDVIGYSGYLGSSDGLRENNQ